MCAGSWGCSVGCCESFWVLREAGVTDGTVVDAVSWSASHPGLGVIQTGSSQARLFFRSDALTCPDLTESSVLFLPPVFLSSSSTRNHV